MTAISIKEFTGMIPRSPDHLLPDNAASFAQDCDFSRSVLQPLKGGLEVLNVGGVIRGMYTAEGSYWYTWPTDVVAHRSPVIDEVYSRIYYIDGSRLRASPSPASIGRTNGGIPLPGDSPLVGVPNPTAVPVLALVDRTTLADYPAATIAFKTWYSDGATNANVADITTATVSPFKRYTFTATRPSDVLDNAALVVQATLTEGTKQLFQLDTGLNSVTPARSAALPGGVTMSLELVSSTSTTTGTPPDTVTTTTGNYAVVFEWGVVETRAYGFTVVNTWDEESGPSPAALASPTYMQDVRVTVAWPDFQGYRPFKQTNIYRTYGGPQYIRAGVLVGFANGFIDSARTVTTIGVSLPSLTWVPPPINMFNLVAAANGWFAGHYRNVLYMSEPFRPHTWQYNMTFPHTILGLCTGPQGIVVTTAATTYLLTGPHPASVTSMELPVPVGGIDVISSDTAAARRSMCEVDGGVAFLSNDGVVLVQGSQASLDISKKYFTREVWRTNFAPHLASMQLAYHDGCLVALSSANPAGFVLEMDEAGGAMTRFNYIFDVLMRLPFLDTLYYSTGGKIYRFREGTALHALWFSKQFISSGYVKLGIAFARMSGSGPVIIETYADDELIHSRQFDASIRTVYWRLPPHRGALKWQFKVGITGAGVVEDIAFAQSPDELKNV